MKKTIFQFQSSARERRKQTIVKMNFDADQHDDEIHGDKSFQSSSESIVIEEKISVKSESIKSAVSSSKSTSILEIGGIKAIGQRKFLSAH